MIDSLRIKNVALIDEVEVSFGDGLNVLTGETGAGKSIVVDSINFLLGERPVRDFIRSGADSASVEGLIDIRDETVFRAVAGLLGVGADMEGDREFLIQRTLHSQGKSVCRINGRIVTVGMLKEISALLVDVHGQHDHQSLLDNRKQLFLLDQFCGDTLAGHKHRLEEKLRQYKENGRQLKALSGVGNQREAQMEILQYQIDEIEKAKLKADEEDALMLRRTRLSGLEKLSGYTAEALMLLDGGETEASASDSIGRAAALLSEIGRMDASKLVLAEVLSEAAVMLSEVVSELRQYSDELEADPQELERVENRLDTIYRLKQKYGQTVGEVLAHYEKAKAKLDKIMGSEAEIKRLNAERRQLTGEITQLCDKMSDIRERQAEQIQAQITEVLTDLGMRHARFEIKLSRRKEFAAEGNSHVEFMISPNLGEQLKPLNRIASGGEMSRVMLAVKTVMAGADRIETLIFDEIDAGVSGRTAQQVAEKLMGISGKRQILCITHLPQIAAMADTHFLIEKKTTHDKTVTKVKVQNRDEIILELARLIGGAKITEATRNAAGEMKQQADSLKKR